jgi:hypothetical protein
VQEKQVYSSEVKSRRKKEKGFSSFTRDNFSDRNRVTKKEEKIFEKEFKCGSERI